MLEDTTGMKNRSAAVTPGGGTDETVSADGNGSESSGAFEVGIVRQFPFSSSLQRMSVITRTLGAKDFELYSKGSPEMISSLSLPHTSKSHALCTGLILSYDTRSFTSAAFIIIGQQPFSLSM